MKSLIRLITFSAATVMAASFSACSTQSVDEYKLRNKEREQTWNERFRNFSDNADRRAEERWDRIMH